MKRHALLLVIALGVSPVQAACHHYRIWRFPKPQRCFTALAYAKPASRHLETFHERIDMPLPDLKFEPCPEGDEKLRGIALLRELTKDR